MKTHSKPPLAWHEVRDALAHPRTTLPEPRPAVDFWAEFHARRAADCATGFPLRSVFRPMRWGVPLALAAALMIATWVAFGPTLARRAPGGIHSLEVTAPHRAVLIFDAPNAGASIVWIEGLETTLNGEIGS